jgi:hypothetical protein
MSARNPSHCPLALCVGAGRLGDVADRGGLDFDLPSRGAQTGALDFESAKVKAS